MKYKVVNIEAGMPTVDIAQKKLYFEITTAKRQRIKALKVIHGYGSTGTGGSLKQGMLRYLKEKKKDGLIKDFVCGEDWSIFNQTARDILDQCSDLRSDKDKENGNPGITIVLI